MSEQLMYFNGINGATGSYELPPMRPQDVASVALGEELEKEVKRTLKIRDEAKQEHFGINADTRNLAETGWGIIFSAVDEQTEAILEALKPLLDLRREQATGQDERYFKIFKGPESGYYPKKDARTHLDFLRREPRLMGPGPANPEKVPYYLLLVGDPQTISYRFQYQLDVQYAVGRIHFDTLEEYAQYAQSVVEAETSGKVQLARRATFFGAKSEHDQATILSADELVKPLADEMAAKQPGWNLQTVLAQEAKKARLGRLLGGDETPALLFTASHGMGFPNGDPRQLRDQGALLCSDWPGPREWREAIPEDFYFAAHDVPKNAQLLGTMAFFFACYGAGTPLLDRFAHKALDRPAEIAPYPFIARLPQQLLGHPNGGALAVVGHVERAWGYSFVWSGAGRQLQVFKDTLDQLMDGFPIGAAVEWFNERHAELSVILTSEIEDIQDVGKKYNPADLAGSWTANNDARGYAILGDPAVRLPVVQEGKKPKERPTVTLTADVKNKLGELDFSPKLDQPAPVPTAPTAPADVQEPEVADYGIKEAIFGDDLMESFKNVAGGLSDALKQALKDLGSLEVTTYTSDDLGGVTYDKETRKFSGALELRALTQISFDGDTQVCLPQREDGKVDRELWQIHLDMVKEAQVNRAELLKTMADLAARLLGK